MIWKVLLVVMTTEIGSWSTLLTKRHHSSWSHILGITSIIYSSMCVIYLQMGSADIPLVFTLTKCPRRLAPLACKCACCAGWKQTLTVCRWSKAHLSVSHGIMWRAWIDHASAKLILLLCDVKVSFAFLLLLFIFNHCFAQRRLSIKIAQFPNRLIEKFVVN